MRNVMYLVFFLSPRLCEPGGRNFLPRSLERILSYPLHIY